MGSRYGVRVAVARVGRKAKGVPVIYVDDVGDPHDDGSFVTLHLHAAGKKAAVIVLTTENFYAALSRVMSATLPNGDPKRPIQ
jgi:hypothetical protein